MLMKLFAQLMAHEKIRDELSWVMSDSSDSWNYIIPNWAIHEYFYINIFYKIFNF